MHRLVTLANMLDKYGLYAEANIIDKHLFGLPINEYDKLTSAQQEIYQRLSNSEKKLYRKHLRKKRLQSYNPPQRLDYSRPSALTGDVGSGYTGGPLVSIPMGGRNK